jgi:hypothetical protein
MVLGGGFLTAARRRPGAARRWLGAHPVFYALVAVAAAMVVRSTGGGVVTALAVLAMPAVLNRIPGLAAAASLRSAAALHGISSASEPGQAKFLSVVPAAGSLIVWTILIGAVAVWRVLIGAAAVWRASSRDV